MKKFKIAVVGAATAVGQEVLKTLAERSFPVSEVVALASAEHAGGKVSFGENDVLTIFDLARYDFQGTDICFATESETTSVEAATRATRAGCIIIDCTTQYRMDPDVPLVVPEVNATDLANYAKRHIVATPADIVTQLVTVLKPLHDIAKIRRIVVASYQSVGSVSRAAMDELFTQTRAIFVNDQLVKEQFRKQIAFNVIPQTSDFMEDGNTKEEWRLMAETKKILDSKIKVTATCVRVPTFVGHALAVNVEFENPIEATEARATLKKERSISVIDHLNDEGFVTPVECAGEDFIFVSRIREDISVENGLNLWIVCDNLRKGTALNAVQVAEILIKDQLK